MRSSTMAGVPSFRSRAESGGTILFSDISSFSARTLDLTPVETLGFVNNFFSWITAEALQGGRGIVDKYIGDALMIVFSKEFGAEDPFVEAVQAARWMGEHDVLSFVPHIGIASGPVVAGYVGTPLRYDASVFGAPVALAARCAGVDPPTENEPGPIISTRVVFPAEEWGERDFAKVFPPQKLKISANLSKSGNEELEERPMPWEIREAREVSMRNLPDSEIREVVNTSMHLPSSSAEERIREAVDLLRKAGIYRPEKPPS